MAKLTPQQDAFGQAMWDYAHGKGGWEVAVPEKEAAP